MIAKEANTEWKGKFLQSRKDYNYGKILEKLKNDARRGQTRMHIKESDVVSEWAINKSAPCLDKEGSSPMIQDMPPLAWQQRIYNAIY